MTDEYISIKKSQAPYFQKIPLYNFSIEGEPLLYKQKGAPIDSEKLQSGKYPELFFHKTDKKEAVEELHQSLNISLAGAIASNGITEIKTFVCEIIEEALKDPFGGSLDQLPETLELLFKGYSENKSLLGALTLMSGTSSFLIEHTVNILSLSLQYCFFHDFAKSAIKKIGISAVLHDIGLTEINQEINAANEMKKLSDSQFEEFQTHTVKGYKYIRNRSNFEKEIALVALEHHEKLDGSGYPRGKTSISEESQLIGLIDSYEYLAYRSKNFRSAQKPFGSLQILKKDVLAGKYNKEMFINLCSCLTH